jgi:prepilin-type processing-associated H-X9-DG protein
MYNGDNTGHIVSCEAVVSDGVENKAAWAPGYCGGADQPGSFAVGIAGETDTYYGPSPFDESSGQALQAGAMWPYVTSLPLYQCPGDHTTVTNAHRFRNYAINDYMNGTATLNADGSWTACGDTDPPQLVYFQREAQLLTPAALFTFIDQDPYSIDDDEFDINPFNSTPAWPLTGMEAPSRVHANCFNWSFADGHAETYKLRDYAKSINWVANSMADSYTVQKSDPAWPGSLNPDWLAVSNQTSIYIPPPAGRPRP